MPLVAHFQLLLPVVDTLGKKVSSLPRDPLVLHTIRPVPPASCELKNLASPLAIGAGILLFGFVLFMVYCLFDRKFDALSSASASNTDNSDDVFRFADFVTVVRNVGFWLIAIVCVLYYASIRTFMNFATDFMVNGFAIDKETAGWVVSLIPFGAIVLSPLFGILYDRTGRGTQMMTIGCVVLTVSLLLLNYPLTHAIWYVLSMMTLVGIAFSLVPAALWPTVPMMVPLKQRGTGLSGLARLLMPTPLLRASTTPSLCSSSSSLASALCLQQ